MNDPVFFMNVKVYKKDNSFFTDRSNWLRLKLYLEPFENVILICEQTEENNLEWIIIPDSVECLCFSLKKGTKKTLKLFYAIKQFLVIFFASIKKLKKCPFVGILVTGPPFFHVGLFASIVTFKPTMGIFIGSISNSYFFSRGKKRFPGILNLLKGYFSLFLEKVIIFKSESLLGAGNILSDVRNKKRKSFSTSLNMLHEIRKHKHVRNDNKIIWSFAGVLNKEKGVDTLLLALKMMRKTDKRHEAILIGKRDKNFEIESFIKEQELSECVTLTGELGRQNLLSSIAQTDIFVFLSLHEGMPKSPLEAMSQCLPVIATATGAEFYVKNGFNGFIVDTNCAQCVVNAINNIFSNDILKHDLIKNALLTAEELSYDSEITKLHQFLISTYPDLTKKNKNDWLIL